MSHALRNSILLACQSRLQRHALAIVSDPGLTEGSDLTCYPEHGPKMQNFIATKRYVCLAFWSESGWMMCRD